MEFDERMRQSDRNIITMMPVDTKKKKRLPAWNPPDMCYALVILFPLLFALVNADCELESLRQLHKQYLTMFQMR